MRKLARFVAMIGQRRLVAFLAGVLYVLHWLISTPALLHAQELLSAQESSPARNDIKFDRIGLEQGLSHNTVWCLLQDRKGFMWLGTEDGLNKYDGYSFKVSVDHNLVLA